MTPESLKLLACAVIHQAVDDWQRLKRDKNKKRKHRKTELKHLTMFFAPFGGMEMLIHGAELDLNAGMIRRKLGFVEPWRGAEK